MCFVLYTEIASYTASRMRRITTGRTSREAPNIAATPAPIRIPSPSITYHSGYLYRRTVERTARTTTMTVAVPVSVARAYTTAA